MSKAAKGWLITAAVLVAAGFFLFLLVIWGFAGDFTKALVKYKNNEYTISESYQNITLVTDTADVVFVPSENEASSVVCYEPKNAEHAVSVKDGTLFIELIDTRKWYEHLRINFRTPKITVSVPQGEYGALLLKSDTGDIDIPKGFQFETVDIVQSTGDTECEASVLGAMSIKTSTGDIEVENAMVGALNLSVSTGEIAVENVSCEGDTTISVSTGKTELENLTCKKLTSNGDTGKIVLDDVIVAETMSINRNTGHVTFDGADAAEIFVKTSTGDVRGTLLSEKVFITQTDTGRVDVPKTISGGKCEIVTDTGDIKLSIKQ